MRKDVPYKNGLKLTVDEIRFNLGEYEKRVDAYDKRTDDEYGHEGCGVYLTDGVTVSGGTWAVMQGLIVEPYSCDCDKWADETCEVCIDYVKQYMLMLNEDILK